MEPLSQIRTLDLVSRVRRGVKGKMPSQAIKKAQRRLEKREREIVSAYCGKKVKKGSDGRGALRTGGSVIGETYSGDLAARGRSQVSHSDEDVVYVVDWDIPVDPPGRRRAFYRALAKLRAAHELHGRLSTASVLILRDRELARAVYNLASQYGTAHIYTATQEA